MKNGIEFKNVSKFYPGADRPAVDDVSFTVEAGQFVVLLGSSGCGKTTLLKMVNRLYEPSSGQIFIDGVDTRKIPVNELRRKIGYVIQQNGLFPHMTVEQNIAVVPDMLGWDKAKTSARIDELLELVHLDPSMYRKRYPRQLSGGQQQRVGLARALAADPPIMLMDEPFGAIDAITRMKLQEELIDIQKKLHKTILFVTHDVDEALRLADRMIILRNGRIVQYGTPADIVLRPADDFVKDLVGSDDLMRQISLIRVADVMEPPDGHAAPNGQTVSERTDMKTVLTLLLRGESPAVHVVDDDGRRIGKVTLADLRKIWAPARAEAKEA